MPDKTESAQQMRMRDILIVILGLLLNLGLPAAGLALSKSAVAAWFAVPAAVLMLLNLAVGSWLMKNILPLLIVMAGVPAFYFFFADRTLPLFIQLFQGLCFSAIASFIATGIASLRNHP